MRLKSIANIYLILALLLGAMLPIMFKIASQNINIYEYLMLTFAVATPTSLIYLLARKKSDRLVATIRNTKEVAFMAFLGLLISGAMEFGLTYSEMFISASLATVIFRSFPLLMLIFLPVMLKERISKYQIAALVLAFAGLYIAVTGGSLLIFSHANIGIIGIVILVAFAAAFVTVAIKKYSFDMEVGLFIFNLATLVCFMALFFAVKAPFQAINIGALVSILYVGIIYNVFVNLMYYSAVRMIKTTFVTNIYFLSPFLTFVFSWLILGEQIYLYYIAIAVLVSAGLLIQKFDTKGGTYAAGQNGSAAKHTFYDVTSAFINTDAPLIYNSIRSGGRVLAIKMDKDDYNGIRQKINNRQRANGTIVYTNQNRRLISNGQDEFVRDMLGVKANDMVLMSAGMPEASERALSELLPPNG